MLPSLFWLIRCVCLSWQCVSANNGITGPVDCSCVTFCSNMKYLWLILVIIVIKRTVVFFKLRESSNFGQGVAKPPRQTRARQQKYFWITHRVAKPPRQTRARFFSKMDCVIGSRNPRARFFSKMDWVIGSRNPRARPARDFFQKWVESLGREPHAPDPREIFFQKWIVS